MERSRNPYPPFSVDIMHMCLDSDSTLSQRLLTKVNEMINAFYCNLKELMPFYNENSCYNIYFGYCGTALVAYLLYKKTGEMKYFADAKELTNLALQNLKGECISFLEGDAGPLALAIILNILEDNIKEADDLIKKLIVLGDLDNQQIIVADDILRGRAGYLYALIFLDQECIDPVIPEMVIRKHVQKIIRAGFVIARDSGTLLPLMFITSDENFIGAANGTCGILYILLIAHRYMTDYELNCLVRPTLFGLLSAELPSKNFPLTHNYIEDDYVQWCHGAPGMVYLLILASKIYNCPAYLVLAKHCEALIWQRGLLKKGYNLCHGVAGNAYIFLHFYKETQDKTYLYKAACFADWCTKYPHNQGMLPDWKYSLFQGMAGILYFLVDIKNPMNAYFPGFELEISE